MNLEQHINKTLEEFDRSFEDTYDGICDNDGYVVGTEQIKKFLEQATKDTADVVYRNLKLSKRESENPLANQDDIPTMNSGHNYAVQQMQDNFIKFTETAGKSVDKPTLSMGESHICKNCGSDKFKSNGNCFRCETPMDNSEEVK